MLSFSHSGDLGDIIYALPTIQQLGGGHLVLGPRIKVRVPMTRVHFENIAPLLKCQSYLAKVTYSSDPGDVDHNLDTFRRYWAKNLCYGKSIARFHAEAFRALFSHDTEPWLCVDSIPKPKPKLVVVSRSHRYHNNTFPWDRVYGAYRDSILFVGTPEEKNSFEQDFGKVDYYPTSNLLELARIINVCDLFVGNQSCPYAIAEGLKKRCIQETYIDDPNCRFVRPGVQYVTGRHIQLSRL